MSLIETTPQIDKPYKGRAQDHGTAATEKGHFVAAANIRDEHAKVARIDQKFVRGVIADGQLDYSSMNHDMLEAAADEILGESTEVLTASPFLNARAEIIKAIANDDDEAEANNLFAEYESLQAERHQLLNKIGGSSFDLDLELIDSSLQLEEELEAIEDAVLELLQYQTGFATEADIDLLTKRQIRNAMAQRVTLDPANEENDIGDNDFNPQMHFITRP